jgi:hypothetical protein
MPGARVAGWRKNGVALPNLGADAMRSVLNVVFASKCFLGDYVSALPSPGHAGRKSRLEFR